MTDHSVGFVWVTLARVILKGFILEDKILLVVRAFDLVLCWCLTIQGGARGIVVYNRS